MSAVIDFMVAEAGNCTQITLPSAVTWGYADSASRSHHTRAIGALDGQSVARATLAYDVMRAMRLRGERPGTFAYLTLPGDVSGARLAVDGGYAVLVGPRTRLSAAFLVAAAYEAEFLMAVHADQLMACIKSSGAREEADAALFLVAQYRASQRKHAAASAI